MGICYRPNNSVLKTSRRHGCRLEGDGRSSESSETIYRVGCSVCYITIIMAKATAGVAPVRLLGEIVSDQTYADCRLSVRKNRAVDNEFGCLETGDFSCDRVTGTKNAR